MEVRYYNRLFDAWETRFERNRATGLFFFAAMFGFLLVQSYFLGIKMLQRLCAQKIHLKPAPPSSLDKVSVSF